MHCDTISELADRGGELWKNSGHLDLKRMQESGYLLQNFALFVDIGKCTPTPWERVCALYEVYRTELEKNKNRIVPVLCYEDILKNEACGKLSALLTVEEGAVCGGSLERLRELYDMGVRMLTLTWNYRNELGWPATRRCLGQSRGNVDGRLTEKSVQEKIPGTGRSSWDTWIRWQGRGVWSDGNRPRFCHRDGASRNDPGRLPSVGCRL